MDREGTWENQEIKYEMNDKIVRKKSFSWTTRAREEMNGRMNGREQSQRKHGKERRKGHMTSYDFVWQSSEYAGDRP